MFSLNILKFASAALVVTVTALTTPASANEMVQNLGPVPAYEPILKTVGNKHVIAFFVPGNGQCNIQTVIWNADDVEANSSGVKISLNPGQTASIDSSATESFKLRCGDHAETLAAIDGNQQFASILVASSRVNLGYTCGPTPALCSGSVPRPLYLDGRYYAVLSSSRHRHPFRGHRHRSE